MKSVLINFPLASVYIRTDEPRETHCDNSNIINFADKCREEV